MWDDYFDPGSCGTKTATLTVVNTVGLHAVSMHSSSSIQLVRVWKSRLIMDRRTATMFKVSAAVVTAPPRILRTRAIQGVEASASLLRRHTYDIVQLTMKSNTDVIPTRLIWLLNMVSDNFFNIYNMWDYGSTKRHNSPFNVFESRGIKASDTTRRVSHSHSLMW